MKAHYAVHIHASVHADGVDDLLGPDGILENMPTRLLEHTEVVSSGCHLQVLDDDESGAPPDTDAKVQALIDYLGPDVALEVLEAAIGPATTPFQGDDKVLISQDAKDADTEAGERVIRAANGEIVRTIKPILPPDGRAFPAGGDRFA